MVPGHAVGIEAAHPEHGVEGAAALPAADRQRGAAHHRHHQDVDVVEDRVDAGDLGGAVGHRFFVERLGEQAAELAEAAGAPFEALRQRHFLDGLGDALEEAGGDRVADPAPVGVALARRRGRARRGGRRRPRSSA